MRDGVSARLLAGDGFEALWHDAALPWFREGARTSWSSRKPTVALVPSRNYAFFIKHRLLNAGMGFAGICFWTPDECRRFLLQRLADRPRVIERRDLRLLLAAEADAAGDDPASRAIARDPSALLHALESLSAAGCDWKALGDRALAPLLARVAARLETAGLLTAAQMDHWLGDRAGELDRPIGSCLIIGFDGAHWAHWRLLAAAADASEQATVCLLQPRWRCEEADQIWIGSWEERCGEAQAVEGPATPAPRPFAALAEGMESQPGTAAVGADTGPVIFHVGYNVKEEARAIAAQAVAFLAGASCTNLGILFPGYGALSREVASLLAGLGIAYNDTLGYNAPEPATQQAWQAWIEFQKRPRLGTFLELLRLAPDAQPAAAAAEDALDRALNEVLVDDLAVLAAFMASSPDERLHSAARFIQGFAVLPERATLAAFLDATRRALEPLGWRDHVEQARWASADLQRILTGELARDAFLTWLDDATRFGAWQRDAARTHPFARVHLLTYGKADWQTWSHLIFSDMNQDGWPPPFQEAPFLGERLVEQLNRRAVRQGEQGEGHRVVKPGKALIVGPAQSRALVQRQFFNLIESASCGLCAAASVTDESDPAHRRIPSDFLTRLFFVCAGRALSDGMLDALRERSLAWTERSALFGAARAKRKDAAVTQTRRAYDARRDPARPFDEYAFALASPPANPLALPCKEWESAVNHPAGAWLKHVLGVEESGMDLADPHRPALVTGTWVHRWLSQAVAGVGGRFAPLPKPGDLLARLDAAARETRGAIEAAFAEAGRAAPEWWEAQWHRARRIAGRLARSITEIEGWPFAVTEWPLPRGAQAVVEGGAALRLSGRMDLVLAEKKDPGAGHNAFWIVDYKTGRSSKRSSTKNIAKNLSKGEGIQLALYGLALAAAGADRIALTLLLPDGSMEPQLTHEDVLACGGFWQGLCRMQDTGVFGMRAEVHPEFGVKAAYPLATLEINADILEIKWQLTHPLLRPPGGEEDAEWD